MGRTVLIAALAGVVAFAAFRVVIDIAAFGAASRLVFLTAPAGGIDGGEAALNAALSYWGALLAAVIVAVVTPIVRWNAAREEPPAEVGAEQRAQARALMALSEPRAQAPARPAEPAGGAAWRPEPNGYAEKLQTRYGPARLRRARKLSEPGRGKAGRTPARAKRA